jgi:hypothetical protein
LEGSPNKEAVAKAARIEEKTRQTKISLIANCILEMRHSHSNKRTVSRISQLAQLNDERAIRTAVGSRGLI